jgi:phenylpyruvate tautomerase PptA (4-oxalocrotonate tautomerase family)
VLIEGDRYLYQEKIAQMLDIHHESVKHILRDALNMPKVNIKCVPHALDSSQKAVLVKVSRRLLDFLESRTGRSLLNVYTADETWVHLDNPRTSMWISADVTMAIRVRCTVTSKKRMFWTDFSRTGIGAVVVLPARQSFNKKFSSGTVLPSIVDNRTPSRPELRANRTFLHLDSARPHFRQI